VAIGASLLVHSGHAMADRPEVTCAARATSALELGAALSLTLGFLTPLGGVLALVSMAFAASSWLGSSTPAAVPHVLPLVVAVSVVLLGPGAFSIDRYAFGPREVVIPGRGDDPPER
jgi:uncharacterized membrane protein YphA (DoxX/SURF4 family)